ncbi:MAG: MATE family efflux transporter, partial [Angelakisella sp.]
MNENSANVLTLGKTPTATVLKLSWPTILEQIAFTVLNFADTAMVGVLGAAYTAAVGITAPVLWLASGI